MKRFSVLFIITLLLIPCLAGADETDDQYLAVIKLADQADSLKTGGHTNAALAKYKEAQRALQTFQRTYPRWNMKLVSYRLNDLSQNVASLSDKAPAAGSSQASSDSHVKLLEPGVEPRKMLRITPKPGDQQTLVMTIKTGLDMKVGDIPNQSVKMPAMEVTMSTKVINVSTSGDITYELQFLDATVSEDQEVMPQISEAMKSSLEKTKGLSGKGTMSNRGISKSLDMKAPEGADPQTSQAIEQMKQSFANLSAPFPAEAVGVGAKWQVKMPFQSQGMKIDQTAIYELASIEGERLTAKSTVSQTAANQKVQNPAMPALKFDLNKMEGHGTGETTFDLSKIFPPEGMAVVHSEMTMGMNAPDQKQTMSMKLDLEMKMSSK